MGYTNRRDRWHSQRRVLKLVTIATLLLCAVGWRNSLYPIFTRGLQNAVYLGSARETKPAHFPHVSRPVFAYSVIRGGAYSRSELNQALDFDPVAAQHYLVFNRTQVRTAQSSFSAPVFLSYRVGNAIYWTSRPVQLPHGETLLTDGSNYARARCGNRISEKPQTPVSESEPAPSTLDQSQPADLQAADVDTWSEDRLQGEERAPVEELSPVPRTPPIVAGPGLPPEVITPPTWWDVSPPLGPVSPIAVIEPNPVPWVPVTPIVVPWTPVTVTEVPPLVYPPKPGTPVPPLVPTTPGTPVPEPALLPLSGLLLGALAARLRRNR